MTFYPAPSLCWANSLLTNPKSGKVTVLFKKGKRTNPSNYRPITTFPSLPTISKILERAVHDQLYKFLSPNDLLPSQKCGFRSTFYWSSFKKYGFWSTNSGSIFGSDQAFRHDEPWTFSEKIVIIRLGKWINHVVPIVPLKASANCNKYRITTRHLKQQLLEYLRGVSLCRYCSKYL